MLVIFFFENSASKYLKMLFYALVVSDQLFNVNGPRAQAQRDELVTRLSFGEMVEFLQVEEFVL